MELTSEQQTILEGAQGDYLAQCMRWLVEWGEVMGARRLIPADNTHVLLPVPNRMARGASPETIERYVADLQAACAQPTHARCTCTVHTLFVTLDDLDLPENDPAQVRMQRDLTAAMVKAGYIPTFTCAPYLVGNVPLKGEICAWTESSAVVYANSILGARTTRHGTESAIAASLLGLVPEFGVLLDENGVVRGQGLVNSREHIESLFEAKRLDLPSIQDETNMLHDPQDITPMALANLGIELASEAGVLLERTIEIAKEEIGDFSIDQLVEIISRDNKAGDHEKFVLENRFLTSRLF